MEFRVLGPLEVLDDGERLRIGGLKQRSILALLVANIGRAVSLDRIVDEVYGDEADPGIRRSVMTFISALRRDLGAEIAHRSGNYVLDVEPDRVDAFGFEQALKSARAAMAVKPEQAGRTLKDALAMWRGHPYEDVELRGALEPEIARLQELRLTALELRIDSDLAVGRAPELIGEVEALAEEYPMRERFRAQQMLALYRAGRQVEALRAFRTTEEFLAEQFGLEPSKELRNLELRILRHDPDLVTSDLQRVTQRAAILACALEGTAQRWERSPEAMANALAAFDRLCTEAVTSAGGQVFRQGADGLLAVFGVLPEAVEAAEAAQRSLTARDWGEVGPLQARMGIDVGDAEAYGGEFVGPPVTRAIRLAAVGHGGQVLISAAVQGDLLAAGTAGVQVRSLGVTRLRGQVEEERVGQLVFPGLPADFPALRHDDAVDLSERGSLPSLPGYELRELVGEGTRSRVYRAYQPSVGREVAIKIIRPEYSTDPDFVRDFERQARVVARLAHPRIVPLHDFWRDTDGAYLVMRLFPAGSLAGVLSAGPMDPEAGVAVVRHIGEALSFAHKQGVVHGDVTAGNVLLDESGNAYLADFGMASGQARAPEGRGTAEDDQYDFGMLMYEILTGQPTQSGAPFEPPSRLRHWIPADIDAVVTRATAPLAADRFPAMEALLDAFSAAIEPAARSAEEEAVVVRNPYKGLRAFDEADAGDFFGRDALITALVDRVAEHRFVTVVGASGSGKSSVARAGLLAALRRGAIDGSHRWFSVTLVPGADPIKALIRALDSIATVPVDVAALIDGGHLAAAADALLAGGEGDLVLVVDQFEELFTLADDLARGAFLDLLAEGVTAGNSRIRVVATLRADHYDGPLLHEGIDRLVTEGQVTVLGPSIQELVEMISRPALAAGLRWEPGLPERIAADVHGRPGALPLLQYALTEVVERRDGTLLTTAGYELIGGASGALAARAEAAYMDFTERQRATAEQILLRLVTVGDQDSVTRRRVRRSELDSLGLDRRCVNDVLDLLIARRLLTTDRDPATRSPTVEIAHEAMLDLWPRLQGWVDDKRATLTQVRRLRAAFSDWESSGRHDDYLLSGTRLASYSTWADEPVLAAPEREFLDASLARRAAERQAATRRRRVVTGIIVGAAVVATVLAIVAISQRTRAVQEARLAEGQALAASGFGLLDSDPELSSLLAAQAVEIDPNDATSMSVLHEAVQRHRTLFALRWEPERTPWDVVIGSMSPRGDRVAVAAFGRDLEVWDIADSSAPLWTKRFDGEFSETMEVAFAADGTTVIAFVRWSRWTDQSPPDGYLDTIYLFDAATGEEIRAFEAPKCFEGFIPAGAHPDPKGPLFAVVAVRTEGGCINYSYRAGSIDLTTGAYEPLTEPVGSTIPGWGSASTDGRILAVGFGGPGQVVDTTTKETLMNFPGGVALVAGNRIVTGGLFDGSLQITDLATGEVKGDLWVDEDITGAVASPDGSRVYVFGADGTVHQFDIATHQEVLRTKPWDAPIVSGIPNSDGSRLALFYADGSMRVIDVAASMRGEVATYDILPSGGRLVSTLAVAGSLGSVPTLDDRSRSTVTLFDVGSGETIRSIQGFGDSPLNDGKVAIQPMLEDVELSEEMAGEGNAGTYQRIGPLQIVDPATGTVAVEMEGLCEWFNSRFVEVPGPDCGQYPAPFMDYGRLAFCPNGSCLAMAGWITQSLTVWDTGSGEVLWNSGRLEQENAGLDVAFTPDGSHLVVGSKTTMRVYDAVTHEVLATVPTESQFHAMAFSADGAHLYATEGQGVRVFDTATWEEIDRFEIGIVYDLALSPDGSRLAAGSDWEDVVIVDTSDGTILQTITFPGVAVPANLAFIDDDHLLVGTAGPGPLVVMTLEPEELVDIARSAATRSPTEEECSAYPLDACP